jgi:hypothetical protein
VLQHLLELLHDDVGLSVLDGGLERNVALDNVDELVHQVILRALGAASHDQGGADVDGPHGEDGDAHPFGAGPCDVENKGLDVLLAHLLEDAHGLLSGEELLSVAAAGDALNLSSSSRHDTVPCLHTVPCRRIVHRQHTVSYRSTCTKSAHKYHALLDDGALSADGTLSEVGGRYLVGGQRILSQLRECRSSNQRT